MNCIASDSSINTIKVNSIPSSGRVDAEHVFHMVKIVTPRAFFSIVGHEMKCLVVRYDVLGMFSGQIVKPIERIPVSVECEVLFEFFGHSGHLVAGFVTVFVGLDLCLHGAS